MSKFTGVEGKNGAEIKYKGGMQGGVMAVIGRSNLQVETGLFYSTKGATLDGIRDTVNNITASVDYTMHYLDIPVMVRYSTSLADNFKFYAHGGLIAGFLQDGKGEVTVSNGFRTQSISGDIDDSLNTFDPRVAVGVGSSLGISKGMALTGALDYQMSVSKINKNDSLGEKQEILNSSIGLNVGLKVDI